MAEQIALDEAGGDGGAVHLDHLVIVAGTQGVNGLGDQLLAGAGLPRMSTVQSLWATSFTFSSTFSITALW